jgi:hypothetical protein
MTFILYFLGSLLAGIILGYVYHSIKINDRKKQCATWEVGDVIVVKRYEVSNGLTKELQKNGNSRTVKLSGWNEDNVMFELGNKYFIEEWKSIDVNKSDYWRTQHNNCKNFMGKDPSFNPIVTDKVSSSSDTDMIDGQPIETLNEIMCEIYLKQAISQENYELADKLRKRMERFR